MGRRHTRRVVWSYLAKRTKDQYYEKGFCLLYFSANVDCMREGWWSQVVE